MNGAWSPSAGRQQALPAGLPNGSGGETIQMRIAGRLCPLTPEGQHRRHARATAPVITGYQERGLSIQESPMPTKIQNLRLQAFQHQQGRCWYCGVQMWHQDPAELPGIPVKSAWRLRCTAEHLLAQCDGGRDEASNVVAACAHCNHTRHKRKNPPQPDLYLADIRKRIARGGWHQDWVRSLGLLSVSTATGTQAKAPSSG